MIYFYIEIPKVFRNIAQVYRQFQHVYKMSEVKAIERIKQNAEEAKNTINTLKNEVSYFSKCFPKTNVPACFVFKNQAHSVLKVFFY